MSSLVVSMGRPMGFTSGPPTTGVDGADGGSVNGTPTLMAGDCMGMACGEELTRFGLSPPPACDRF